MASPARSRATLLIIRQQGVITLDQARSCGLSVDEVRGLRERGAWLRVLPRVFRSADVPFTADARIRAAGLWAGSPAWVCGLAAAYWLRVHDEPPRQVTLTVPRRRGLWPRAGIAVIRRELDPADRAWVRGLAVTGLAVTTLAAATALGPAGEALLDRALQGRVTMDQLRAAHHRQLGTTGSRAAGELLSRATDGAAARSERLFLALLRDAGIGGWQPNHRMLIDCNTIVVDVAFVRARLAIEIDGWAWHHAPDRFQRDRSRQNALVNAGWRVLRFTWLDLTRRPEAVIRQVRAALS